MRDSSTVQWKWVRFECRADAGSEVFVGGTFNLWKPSISDKLRDKKHEGRYRTLLKVRLGRHEYRFRVNGAWLINPDHPVSVSDEDATLNNVMDVV